MVLVASLYRQNSILPDVPQYDGSGGGIRRYWSLDCIVRIDNSAGPDAIVQTEIVCPGPKLRGWEDEGVRYIRYTF